MRREYRLRLRIPRASAQAALLAALLAWPGSVLCPVQQTASVVGFVADESRPGAAVMLTTNQTTLLGSDPNSVITMVPQNCFPAQNTTVYGCTGSPNPASCGSGPTSSQLFLPATGGIAYNNGGGGLGSQGSPTCYNPANSATNPLRRVYLPARDLPVVASRSDPDIFRFDADIRVDRLCFWGTCSNYWPLEFSACSVSGSCSSAQSCLTTGQPPCETSGTRGSIQTIEYDWVIPGSTVPVPPLPQTEGTVFNPWKFRHGIVGLFTTSCGGTPDQPVGTCGSGIGCEIPYHLAEGKRDFTPSPLYPPNVDGQGNLDGPGRLIRSDSVNLSPQPSVTVTMNCFVTYPTAQPSQVKGHCTITIPVQNTAQSCIKYRFMPSASCTERFPDTPDNRNNGLFVDCPTINISG